MLGFHREGTDDTAKGNKILHDTTGIGSDQCTHVVES